MASGCVSRHGAGWRYVIEAPRHSETGRRKQYSKGGFRTRREAQQALNAVRAELDAGTFAEPTKLSLSEFVRKEWLPTVSSSVREGTLCNYRRDFDRYVLPRLGGIRLQDLTAGRLSALYASLLIDGKVNGGPLAPKSVRNIAGTVHRALADAAKWKYLSQNPADLATLPRLTRTEMEVWSLDQMRHFLDSVQEDRLYAVWALLCTTGMRRGEALGLRWSDVDLEEGRLSIRQSLTVLNYSLRFSPPKTSAGVRALALDAFTVVALRAHRVRQAEERLAWGPSWSDTGLVFTREDGTPVHPQRLSSWFTQRVKAAGLPRIRLHDLRHSYATAALRAGVPAKVVSQRLGHASIAITLDTYSHVLPGMDEQAAQLVADSILG